MLIIGGGHAGAALVSALRAQGFSGEVALFSDEAHLPYQRPPLSKAFLSGAMEAQRLLFRKREFYDKQKIALHLDERVVAIDRQAQRIETSKNSYAYDKLAIATGGRPRVLADTHGRGHGRAIYLHNQQESVALREALERTSGQLGILGGGYIGLEVAATARKSGIKVQVFESAARILSRVAAEEISNFFTAYHQQQGVSFRLEAQAELVEGGVRLKGEARDEFIACDNLLVGIGMEPNMELARAAGLEIKGGIVVNERQETADKNIVALGDCVCAPHPLYEGLIRLESVQNANYQAAIAARALCGLAPPPTEAPWFWSDQYDIKLQIAGLSRGYDDIIMRGDKDKASFALFYLAKNKVIAVDCINRPQEFLLTRKFLSEGKPIALKNLSDDSLSAKEIFI